MRFSLFSLCFLCLVCVSFTTKRERGEGGVDAQPAISGTPRLNVAAWEERRRHVSWLRATLCLKVFLLGLGFAKPCKWNAFTFHYIVMFWGMLSWLILWRLLFIIKNQSVWIYQPWGKLYLQTRENEQYTCFLGPFIGSEATSYAECHQRYIFFICLLSCNQILNFLLS